MLVGSANWNRNHGEKHPNFEQIICFRKFTPPTFPRQTFFTSNENYP